MAIFTINVDSNYSAIKGSLADEDTIRIGTNAVRLTIDEQPLLTNITVDSPGVSGRVTVSGAWDLSTWTMVAGTVPLINGTFPLGAVLGSVTGGEAASALGVSTNEGTIITVFGGSGGSSHGVSVNNGTITTATGGTGSSANGVATNNGSITTANGGPALSAHGVTTNNGTVNEAFAGTGGFIAHGVLTNNGTVNTARGTTVFVSGTNNGSGVNGNLGTVINAIGGLSTNSCGVFTNSATVINATGGSGINANGVFTNNGNVTNALGGAGAARGVGTNNSFVFSAIGSNTGGLGININYGTCFRAIDVGQRAIGTSFGNFKFVDGPNFQGNISVGNTTLTTLYTIGPLHPSAVLPAGVTVIELSADSLPIGRLISGGV